MASTVLGQGLDVPDRDFELIKGGTWFVDSSDSEYDPKVGLLLLAPEHVRAGTFYFPRSQYVEEQHYFAGA